MINYKSVLINFESKGSLHRSIFQGIESGNEAHITAKKVMDMILLSINKKFIIRDFCKS